MSFIESSFMLNVNQIINIIHQMRTLNPYHTSDTVTAEIKRWLPYNMHGFIHMLVSDAWRRTHPADVPCALRIRYRKDASNFIKGAPEPIVDMSTTRESTEDKNKTKKKKRKKEKRNKKTEVYIKTKRNRVRASSRKRTRPQESTKPKGEEEEMTPVSKKRRVVEVAKHIRLRTDEVLDVSSEEDAVQLARIYRGIRPVRPYTPVELMLTEMGYSGDIDSDGIEKTDSYASISDDSGTSTSLLNGGEDEWDIEAIYTSPPISPYGNDTYPNSLGYVDYIPFFGQEEEDNMAMPYGF